MPHYKLKLVVNMIVVLYYFKLNTYVLVCHCIVL